MNLHTLLAALPVFAVAAALTQGGSAAATPGRFEFRTVKVKGVAHRFAVWLPPGFTKDGPKRPAILFLHGSGESGTDGEKETKVGLGPALEAHPERWPFVVVMPQKPSEFEEWWEHEDLAFAALDDAARVYRLDERRVALVGMSQGGHGAWMMAARYPDRWRCVVPICGYARAHTVAPRISRLPVWCFQGLKDDVVNPHETREIVRWLRDIEKRDGLDTTLVRATFFPDANHDAWDPAFAEPELPVWIAQHLAAK